jgi:hypothetical protein
MEKFEKQDISAWPEQDREFALALVEVLSDEKRARLSEHISVLKQAPQRSIDDEDYDTIADLRVAGTLALLAYGAEGLNALYELTTMSYPRRNRVAFYWGPLALLSVVFNRDMYGHIQVLHSCLGDVIFERLVQDILNTYKSPELQREAHRQFSRVVYSFVSQPSERHFIGHMIGWVTQILSIGDKELRVPAINLMLESLVQGTLNISDTLCHQLELLILSNLPERTYQEFFEKCPAFIDPLASSIVERQHMGEMWRSDFVIRRLDDQYIFVEIEKPQDSPFTSYPHPSAALSHALGQVLNWFVWVEDNIAYAQSHGFPGIHLPKGVVVIGRNTDLNSSQLRMLKALNDTLHPRIHIETYDDVLLNARNIIRNLTAK